MAKMKKLVIILVDGLDPEVIEKQLEELPNIRMLIQQGQFQRLDSVFPPDSIPAWTTIYTGLNPGEHGIFESFNYLQLKQKDIHYDASIIRGNTFWDKVSNQGYRVGVLNPFLAYPSWEVNGFMISGPIFESGAVSSNRPDLIARNAIPPLGAVVDFPAKSSYRKFLRDTMELTRRQNDLAVKLFSTEKSDLFFYGLLTLDRIKHFYWKFTDKTDPKYPGRNPYERVIIDIYKEVDRFVGIMRQVAGHEYGLILMSDHGHQQRVTKTFNINEWLRRKKYITAQRNINALIEVTKNLALDLFFKLDITEYVLKYAKKIPGAKKLKDSSHIIKSDGIFVPRFAGMNPYGGIVIHKDRLSATEYRSLVDGLILELSRVKDPKTNQIIMEWVGEREEIYKGRNIERFPNIIFKLNDEYGVNRSLFTRNITGINPFHSNLSGGHRRYGTFIFSEKNPAIGDSKVIHIEEIHDLILKIFYNDEAAIRLEA